MSRIREAVMELLFPTRGVCLNCGDPSGLAEPWLCEACRKQLRPRLHAVHADDWPEDGISRALFSLYYEPPVSRLIRQFKYSGVYRLAPFLIEQLEPVIEGIAPGGFDCVLPVPLHGKRMRERGFNQAELLARYIAERCGIPLSENLRRTRNTRKQARLSARRRRRNLENAFAATASFEGMRVLLVDDVLTTGSTLNSCARALRQAGAADVQAVTLAGSRHYRHHQYKIYRQKPKKCVETVNPP